MTHALSECRYTCIGTGSRWHFAVFHLCLPLVAGVLLMGSPTLAQAPPREDTAGGTEHVLLTNDHVITGTVLMRGDAVIVRRGNDSEITLRPEQVRAVAADMPALFAARARTQRRRSPPSIGHRLSDARWCIDQEMATQARELLKQVDAIAPGHPVARHLESRLRRQEAREVSATEPANTDAATPKGATASEDIRPVSHSRTVSPADRRLPADDSPPADRESSTPINATTAPESLHGFTAKVQPILISRCAKCHHEQAAVPTKWNLVLPPGGSSRVTQPGSIANLNATLRLCNPSKPRSSELIERAIQKHAGRDTDDENRNVNAQAPIREHERVLLRTMLDWIASLSTPPASNRSRSNQPSARFPSQSEGTAADLTTAEDSAKESLSPIEPSDVASSLQRPPTAPPLEGSSDRTVSPQTTAESISPGKPTRLPLIENANGVHHFNRETRLRRQLGLEHY